MPHFLINRLCRRPLIAGWVVLLALPFSVFAQTSADTMKVKELLLHSDTHYYNGDLDSAAWYCVKAGNLAKKTKYDLGFADYVSHYIHILNRQGRYAEALELTLEAIEVCKRIGDHSGLAAAYNNAANEYQYLGQLKPAATHYLNALIFSEGDKSLVKQRYTNNLASVFLQLEDKEKAYYYADKGLKLARENGDSVGIASSLVNFALSEIMNKKFDAAEAHLREVMELGKGLKDDSYVLDAYINLGDLENQKGNYSAALIHYNAAAEVLKSYPSDDYELYVQWGLASNSFHLARFNKAKAYLEKSIELAKLLGGLQELRKLYLLGSQIQEKTGNYNAALQYRKMYESLNDSLINAETRQTIHTLEIQHQTSLKEKQIAEQKLALAESNLRIESKDKWLFLSTSIGIALLSVTVLGVVYFRNRQRKLSEEMKLMEKQHHIQELTARMDGEEKERARLARELHDGVGGLLSATRMHASSGHLTADANAKSKIDRERVLSLLDQASREIRNIAHNLSPDIVVSQGLDTAIRQFCNRLSTDTLQIECFVLGDPTTLDARSTLTVYRIVQELTNNVVKHANASHALVQVSVHDEVVLISVEDNGVGYDASRDPGIGLLNLRSRIEERNGTMAIDSSPNKGTVVNIELKVVEYQPEGVNG
jgi:signal transduction histidine kinase